MSGQALRLRTAGDSSETNQLTRVWCAIASVCQTVGVVTNSGETLNQALGCNGKK